MVLFVCASVFFFFFCMAFVAVLDFKCCCCIIGVPYQGLSVAPGAGCEQGVAHLLFF